MPTPKLTDWNADDVLTHEHLQEPVDALRELFRAHDPSTPRLLPTSTSDARFLLLLGKVTTTGPAGEADFTDERHWVRVHGIQPTTGRQDQITLDPRYDLPTNPDDPEEAPVPFTVPATNLTDLAGHTHSLASGTPVMLVPVYDAQDIPSLHYLIIPSAPTTGLKYGKMVGTWTAGTNQVTLTPCVGPTDGTATGASNVTVYIQFPIASPAPCFGGLAGDILCYQNAGGVNVLLSPPMIPRSGTKFQALINQGDAGTSDYRPDFVRGRGS